MSRSVIERDHAAAFPVLAADAFVQRGDGDALRALAPHLSGLADRSPVACADRSRRVSRPSS